MSKKSFQKRKPRIPLEVDGIQVNFCKNPMCTNYGIPASTKKQPRGPGAASLHCRDTYTIHGSKRSTPRIHCHHCNENPPIKSNQGISEEFKRMSLYFDSKEQPCCPNKSCKNHSIGIVANNIAYQSFGKTRSGSQRFRCKVCGRCF